MFNSGSVIANWGYKSPPSTELLDYISQDKNDQTPGMEGLQQLNDRKYFTNALPFNGLTFRQATVLVHPQYQMF